MGDYLAELVEGQSSLNQHHSGTLETSFDGDCVSGSVERDDYRACRLEEARNARNARCASAPREFVNRVHHSKCSIGGWSFLDK